MRCYRLIGLILTYCTVLIGCGSNTQEQARALLNIDLLARQKDTGRWYSQQQLDNGQIIYTTHCAGCHGSQGEGMANWDMPTSNGQYPAPPLNGSAHAWHHPMPALLSVIQEGGNRYGGTMPAWKDTLNINETLSAIAFFQHFWPQDVYERWRSYALPN
jgi:mono/diheme cytochrome c family protein